MKSIVVCGVSAAVLLLAAPAMGADLSEAPLLMKAPPPISDWTGFYLGANGGWGFSSPTSAPGLEVNIPGITVTPIFQPPSLSGWVLGGHAGYNYQTGPWVGGLELDVDASDIKQTQTTFLGPVSAGLGITINDIGSVRARVGVLPTNWLLVYATGGMGWAQSTVTASFSRAGFGSVSDTADQNSVGYVVGGGVEAKFGEHFLVRGEYLFYDFGTQSVMFPNSAVFLSGNVLADGNAKVTVSIARGGVGWKF